MKTRKKTPNDQETLAVNDGGRHFAARACWWVGGMVVGNLKVQEKQICREKFFLFVCLFFFSCISTAVGQPVKRVHAQLEAKMH